MTTREHIEKKPLFGLAGLEIKAWVRRHMAGRTFWIFLVWVGVNAGPWLWRSWPAGITQYVHSLRAGMPIFVLAAGLPVLLKRQGVLSGPLKFWIFYGMIGLVASLYSPHPIL